MKKYEHARFIIERFDHYYDAVNAKGSFYIGLNTFIFGGICVGYLGLHTKVIADNSLWLLFTGLIVCNVLSTYFTIMALMPFLKDGEQEQLLPSLIYFGGITRYELPYYKEKFNELNDEGMLDELIQQAHCLAKGLDGKYKKLKYAGLLVIAEFILMLPLLFLIIKNLKP